MNGDDQDPGDELLRRLRAKRQPQQPGAGDDPIAAELLRRQAAATAAPAPSGPSRPVASPTRGHGSSGTWGDEGDTSVDYGGADQFLRGMSFSWSDKFRPAIDAAIAKAARLGQGAPLSTEYRQRKTALDAARVGWEGDHPIAKYGYEIAGGLLPIIATMGGAAAAAPEVAAAEAAPEAAQALTRGARLAKSAAQLGKGMVKAGATGFDIGAITGAAHAEGGIDDYVKQIGKEAALGAVTSALFVPAAAGIGTAGRMVGIPKLVSAIAQKGAETLPAGRMQNWLATLAASTGTRGAASQQLGPSLAADVAGGHVAPELPADFETLPIDLQGPTVQKVARDLAGKPTAAGVRMTKALIDRQDRMRAAVAPRLEQGTGMTRGAGEALTRQLRDDEAARVAADAAQQAEYETAVGARKAELARRAAEPEPPAPDPIVAWHDLLGGPTQNNIDVLRNQLRARSAAAGENFGAARAGSTAVESPALDALAETDVGRTGLRWGEQQTAQRRAGAAALGQPVLGAPAPVSTPVSVPPAIQAATEALSVPPVTPVTAVTPSAAAAPASAGELGSTLMAEGTAERAAAQAARGAPVRNARGELRRNLGKVSTEDLNDEWQRLVEANATEEAQHGAVKEAGYRDEYLALPDKERIGRSKYTVDAFGNKIKRWQEDLPDASGLRDSEKLAEDNAIVAAYNKNTIVRAAREKAIARIEKELAGRGAEAPGTDFEFGSNAPPAPAPVVATAAPIGPAAGAGGELPPLNVPPGKAAPKPDASLGIKPEVWDRMLRQQQAAGKEIPWTDAPTVAAETGTPPLAPEKRTYDPETIHYAKQYLAKIARLGVYDGQGGKLATQAHSALQLWEAARQELRANPLWAKADDVFANQSRHIDMTELGRGLARTTLDPAGRKAVHTSLDAIEARVAAASPTEQDAFRSAAQASIADYFRKGGSRTGLLRQLSDPSSQWSRRIALATGDADAPLAYRNALLTPSRPMPPELPPIIPPAEAALPPEAAARRLGYDAVSMKIAPSAKEAAAGRSLPVAEQTIGSLPPDQARGAQQGAAARWLGRWEARGPKVKSPGLVFGGPETPERARQVALAFPTAEDATSFQGFVKAVDNAQKLKDWMLGGSATQPRAAVAAYREQLASHPLDALLSGRGTSGLALATGHPVGAVGLALLRQAFGASREARQAAIDNILSQWLVTPGAQLDNVLAATRLQQQAARYLPRVLGAAGATTAGQAISP